MTSGRIGRSAKASALTRSPGQIKSNHGGYREGSGRKPVLESGANYTFRLAPEHLARIDAWAHMHGFDTRSAALRHLIETAQ